MLPRRHRLTRGDDYRIVVRRGERRGGKYVTTHLLSSDGEAPPRFGFIITRAVGGAVVRNTVRRRLKAVCAEFTDVVPKGADVVLRASPAAAEATFDDLRGDVDRGIRRLLRA